MNYCSRVYSLSIYIAVAAMSRLRAAFASSVVVSLVLMAIIEHNQIYSLIQRLTAPHTNEGVWRRPYLDKGKICDEECLRFRHHIDSWSRDKPRAAILMLLQRQSLESFASSMTLFYNNSNAYYRYPIIVFHEADVDLERERDRFRASFPDPALLFFQRVTLEFPSFIHQSAVPLLACVGQTVGYRHMCRFHVSFK